MEGLNAKKDIEAAITIIENSEEISGSDYDHYSKIFNLPTLKHKPLYEQIGNNWQNFLGVLGSSDPWLNAVIMGSKNIVTFDINCLNVYFAYLKIAGIEVLTYQEYLDYFYATNWDKYFCKSIYDKLKFNLPFEIRKVWDSLYEIYPTYKIKRLFFHKLWSNNEVVEEVIIPNNIYLTEQQFYRLKKILEQIKFKYYIADFGEIPHMLKGQKFDVIYLSCMNNLIYDNVHGYNYFDKLREYESLLSKDGTLQGGYLYGYQTDWSWIEYASCNFMAQDYKYAEIEYADDLYDIAFIKRCLKRTDD